MHVTIVIPTWNRAMLLGGAIKAALAQTHRDVGVLVVDDASTDDTRERLHAFRDDPRVSWVRLARNRGPAAAKNLGLLLAPGDAVTFHDSDDIPARDKIAVQVKTLGVKGAMADPSLNWAAVGRRAGEAIRTDVALAGHVLIALDGSEILVDRATSLAEDVFPNLCAGQNPPGDRIHVNAGLFRRDVFERLGGFADSLEEERDLRNRILVSGIIVDFLPRPLMTKFECPDSHGLRAPTGHRSKRRDGDRAAAWERLADEGPGAQREAVDLSLLAVAEAHGHGPLRINSAIPTRGFHPSLAPFGAKRDRRRAASAVAHA